MFVGRDVEIASLAEAHFRARSGAAQIALVVGEAGIGKSWFVRELASRVQARLVVGSSVPVAGVDIPFAPVADLLRSARRDEALADAVRKEPATAGLLPLAPDLWREQRSDADRPETAAVFEATLALLATLSEAGPLIVLLEDLHWADAATWELMAFLSRTLVDERVLLVATLRDDEVATSAEHRRMLAALLRSDKVCRVQLRPLGPEEIAAQVAALAGAPVSAVRVRDIVERSGGNPLFVEALASGDGTPGAVPEALEDLLATRIADLPSDSRAVLRVMGVVGRRASHELLAAATAMSDEALEAALRPAVEARLLSPVQGAVDAYAFRHPLFADAAAADALPSERRRLHGRVADALAADPDLAVTPGGVHGERGAHLLAAQRLAEALHEYLAAATISMHVAPGPAYRQLEQVLDLWDRVDASERPAAAVHVDVLWNAAEMAEITGAGARAIGLAQAALAADTRPVSAARLERLGRYLWAGNRLAESEAAYRQAAAAIPDGDSSLDTACAHMGLGQAAYLACRYADAEEHCRAAISMAADLGDSAERVRVHASRVLGAVVGEAGRDDEAVAMCRDAYERAVAIGDPERHLAAIYLVVVLAGAGRDEEAVRFSLDAMADAQRAGLHASFGTYLAALAAESMIHIGRWEEAATLLGQQPSTDDAIDVSALRIRLAQVWLSGRRGDHERVRELLTRCLETDADPWHRLLVLFRQGEAALDRGDWATAAAAAEEGRAAVTSENVYSSVRLLWVDVTARVELLLDARARQEPVDPAAERGRLLGEIEAVRRSLPGPGGNAYASAFLQLAVAEAGRLAPSASAERWGEMAHTWTHLARPWRAAQARLRQAEAAVDAGDVGIAELALRSANQVANELGARPLIAAAEQLAGRARLRLTAPQPASSAEENAAPTLGLTSREAEVLSLVSQGYSNREIGEQLYVSGKTVSVHVSNILRKLGVTTRVQAAAVAQRLAG